MHKAELAVGKKAGRSGARRHRTSLEQQKLTDSFGEQIADQKVQVDNLKSALQKLEGKLAEARARSELLLARHRRAKALGRTVEDTPTDGFDRMNRKVQQAEALAQARTELLGENLDDRFAALEKEDEVERLLAGLKAQKQLTS